MSSLIGEVAKGGVSTPWQNVHHSKHSILVINCFISLSHITICIYPLAMAIHANVQLLIRSPFWKKTP